MSNTETFNLIHEEPDSAAEDLESEKYRRLQASNVRKEAERRTRFVLAIGHPLCGYRHGYADGFEHAIEWLFDPLLNPFDVDYRPDAGMKYAKEYYLTHPTELARVLKAFDRIVAHSQSK